MNFKGNPQKSPWRFVFLALAIISGAVLAVDSLLPRLALHSLNNNAMSVGIIGGADGPTAVFITAGSGSIRIQLIPWLTLSVGTAGFLLLHNRKPHNTKKEEEA